MTSPPAAEAALVVLEDVHKRYRDGRRRVEAVAGVSLTIPRGVLWAIRGPSGSGKSTLLGLLGGMIVPTSGRVTLDGEDLTHLRDRHRTELRRDKVGFVFQELALIGPMTVLENLLLPLVPTGGARPADRARAMGLLDRFGLADRAGSRAADLSGGERQRAAIARALIRRPLLLLLDEPTAHLDSDNAREVTHLLHDVRDDGSSIVVATHDARVAVDGQPDRLIDLVDGRMTSSVETPRGKTEGGGQTTLRDGG
ncbi:MAG: ABC transporter ATP-binding protein [Sandaracinaceae bacterium]